MGAKGDAHDQSDELEPGRAAGSRTCVSDIVPSALSDQSQAYGCAG